MRTMMVRHLPRAAFVGGWLLLAVVAMPAIGRAQPAEWKQLETSQQLTDYRLSLRDGAFDDSQKSFLTSMALPQLGLPANRGSIERVRRRMRELLCGDAASDQKALDAALQTIVDFMAASARNDRDAPVVRINALLLVGEIKGKDGKPWPAAAAPLAAAVADPKLPLPLRIVAAQGLARHVEAAGPAAVPVAGPAVVRLLASLPQVADRAGAEWLAARAFAMVADMAPAAPPEAAAAAFAVLQDPARSPTLRVRAAAALAAAEGKAAGIDVGKAVAACRATATAALERDKARLERDRELALLGGGNPQQPGLPAQPGFGRELGFGGQPGFGGESDAAGQAAPVSDPVFDRTVWELMTLAQALVGADGKGGLAAFPGADQRAARELATTLQQAAQTIEATPDEISILDALATLTGEPAPAPREAAAPPGEGEPAKEEAGGVVNPFGQ